MLHMDNEIKIEKGIPIPERGGNGGLTATLRKMEVGDSFVVKRPCSVHFCARQIGIKVKIRSIDDHTMRVWVVSKNEKAV